MFELVSKFHNNSPIYPIRPELFLSTDDAFNYIFDGKGSESSKFKLVATTVLQKAGTRSKYDNYNSNNICGMRVKLTYTYSLLSEQQLQYLCLFLV